MHIFTKKNFIPTFLFFTCFLVLVLWGRLIFAASITATITPGVFEPEAPQNLAASIDDRRVDLSWASPLSDGGSAITDYVIQYKLSSGAVWSTLSDGINTNTTFSVSSLSNDVSYDFRVAAVNDIGQGDFSSQISATPGVPAQVIIQGITDTTISSIVANVRITNEGAIAYEYQYGWCITDSENNLCGGGDDIFGSTAAKLIEPGSNFDTSLEATLGTTGNYWFHLNVQFGSDISYASQSFTAVSSASSGGGGGGSSSGSASLSTQSVKKTSCVGADFNCDDKVSSVDFSMLLSFWKQKPPFKNPYVDMNKDNKVDSVDFSILLYQWGKRPTPVL